MKQFRFPNTSRSAFAQNSNWFLIWGILLAVLGIAAVSASVFTTMLTVVIIGFLVLFAGCVMLLDTITFWRSKTGSTLIPLLFAILYIAVGLTLISNPVESSVSITFLIGVFLVVVGIFRLLASAIVQMPRWGWIFVNGIVSLALGVMILNNLPQASLIIIGLFVGIDLFFMGWFYIMAALAAKSLK